MAVQQLRNAPFRFTVTLGEEEFDNDGTSIPVFGTVDGDDLKILFGQFDSVTLPIPSRSVEDWLGSGITTEPVRTVIERMSCSYMMGGWDERLFLGLHNDSAQLVVHEYLRPIGGGSGKWRRLIHTMTGPFQDFDRGQTSQATINRTTIPQDVLYYKVEGKIGAGTTDTILREVDVIQGVNKVIQLKAGANFNAITESSVELVELSESIA